MGKVRNQQQYIETLCNTCKNAVPQLCGWIGRDDLTGVEYTTREARHISRTGRLEVGTIYTVTQCKRYAEGQLPPLGKLG